MKIKRFAAQIAKLAKEHPNLEVVSSKDEEGNSFEPVYFDPTIGNFDGISNFTSSSSFPDLEVNSICIN